MDASDDSSEITFGDFDGSKDIVLISGPLPEIHNAIEAGDLHKLRRCIESGESVNKQEHNFNFTPLHIAVLYNNLELLDYLLTNKDVEVDARCSKGRTPLYLAAKHGYIKLVEKLIHAGSDVNKADNDNDTALHLSARFPPIARLLIQHGARIRTDDSQNRTLHTAAESGCLDLIHMLLYYNVDANVPNEDGCTPFMVALIYRNEEVQEVLLEYVDDFNRFGSHYMDYRSTLAFALRHNSPFVKDIIERGADVNRSDYVEDLVDDNAFLACVECSVDPFVFKMVWERLRWDCFNYETSFVFYNYLSEMVKFLPVIIESDNFGIVIQFLSKIDYVLLVRRASTEQNFGLNQLTAFTCRLIEYGFQLTVYDIHEIFSHYGYCDLFRMLLYMDNDLSQAWLPQVALMRLIFDIDYNLESVAYQLNDIPKETVLQLIEYSICPRLIDSLTLRYSDDESMSTILGRLSRVPSLTELARNIARKYIWKAFKITNNCQFYTTIDHLDIAPLCKTILTFKRKIYRVK